MMGNGLEKLMYGTNIKGISKYEEYEYKRMMNIYKGEIMHIREDMLITEEERAEQLAIVNHQISTLKKHFISKLLPKEKYDRAKEKRGYKNAIKKSIDDEMELD